jgi:hypothetical protein
MKAYVTILLSLFFFSSLAQTVSYPSFEMMRSEEDYTNFDSLGQDRTAWEKLKYIPYGKKHFLSLGGNFRAENQHLQNEDWAEGNDDSPLYIRFMFHADWQWNNRWRLFGQLKSGHAIGRNGPEAPLNVDRLDFHQLFIAYRWQDIEIEIGRRELIYGSRRLISIREGTNVRQSFDGGRMIWRKPGQRLDLLTYWYNPQRAGYFDNRFTNDQALWGAYYVRNFNATNLDVYYLGVQNQNTRFEEGGEEEIRHSIGARHWGNWNGLKYNTEIVGQFGRYDSNPIQAWTISTDISYPIAQFAGLTAGLKAEIIRGDESVGDGKLQTFNPLYPRGGYFGLLAVIGPSNLMDIHPSLKMTIAKRWNMSIDWDFFWRHQLGDGIYFPSGRLNVAGSASDERFIGHQAGIQLGTAINRFVEIDASYFYFFPGEFLKDVTEGAPFSQFGISLNAKF